VIEDVQSIKNLFIEEKKSVDSLLTLNQLRVKYLGKKGIVTSKIKSISSIQPDLRRQYGKLLNELKEFMEKEIKILESNLKQEEYKKLLLSESIDITLPGKYTAFGNNHPITRTLEKIISIFTSMGFEIEDGPEVELDYYNFEALNIPKEHPARDMQDTFYITEDVLLRTHTSPVQIRVMEKKKPPLRAIVPGKVYRCDADISHTPMFHQVEGFMVDKNISFSDLKGVLKSFLQSMFSEDMPIRFRPSFFPFTEPSAEVDIRCIICSGSGCRVCKNTGWLEILGAGMINPKLFEFVGYDKKIYTGFAFGMGVERIAMLLYSIDDIRMFFENDLRFLKQF
jgi:phenylalanyl-tRNA synthetase alpha chain